MTARWMTCAYCGTRYAWPDRHFWPSRIYAQCWPCLYRHGGGYLRQPEPLWWRVLSNWIVPATALRLPAGRSTAGGER